MRPPPRPAIVVTRHGEDLDKRIGQDNQPAWDSNSSWKAKIAPAWPKYTVLPPTTTVELDGSKVEGFTVQQHGLNVEGEKQAKFLATYLGGVLQNLGVAPLDKTASDTAKKAIRASWVNWELLL